MNPKYYLKQVIALINRLSTFQFAIILIMILAFLYLPLSIVWDDKVTIVTQSSGSQTAGICKTATPDYCQTFTMSGDANHLLLSTYSHTDTTATSGSFRMGIYTDDGGAKGDLLSTSNEVYDGADWDVSTGTKFDWTFEDVDATDGTTYWYCCIDVDLNGGVSQQLAYNTNPYAGGLFLKEDGSLIWGTGNTDAKFILYGVNETPDPPAEESSTSGSCTDNSCFSTYGNDGIQQSWEDGQTPDGVGCRSDEKYGYPDCNLLGHSVAVSQQSITLVDYLQAQIEIIKEHIQGLISE